VECTLINRAATRIEHLIDSRFKKYPAPIPPGY
jgi:hypothetical protein